MDLLKKIVRIFSLSAFFLIILLNNTNAAVQVPYIEMEFLPGDDSVNLTSSIFSTLQIKGHATSAMTDTLTQVDITDLPFELTTIFNPNLSVSDGSGGFIHTAIAGTLNIDNGNALIATLINIELNSTSNNSHTLNADVLFSSGNLVLPGVTEGRFESVFTGPAPSLDFSYFASGNETLSASIGPLLVEQIDLITIPVPGALFLFMSSLIGLFRFNKIAS